MLTSGTSVGAREIGAHPTSDVLDDGNVDGPTPASYSYRRELGSPILVRLVVRNMS